MLSIFSRSLLLVVALSAICAAAYAAEQEEAWQPNAEELQAARALRKEGNQLFDARAFAEASLKLRAAYLVEPEAATLERIARAERELGQHAEAHASYEGLLTLHADQLSPGQLSAAEVALRELEEETGVLELILNELPEVLLLDGVAVEPMQQVIVRRLNPGSHTVRATRPGSEPYEQSVEVTAGALVALDVTLEPEDETGWVVVREASGGELMVLVDGAAMGPAPWEGYLLEGTHTIEGLGSTLAAEPQSVQVLRKERHEVVLRGKPRTGTLTIRVATAGATLSVEGQPHPLPFSATLPTGPHQFTISAAGYHSESREVIVSPDEERFELIQLVPVDASSGEPAARTLRPGILLGLLALPRPLQAELGVRIARSLAVGVQYSALPEVTLPLDLDETARGSMSAWQVLGRWFPFEGAFFVGAGFGIQTLTASVENALWEVTLRATTPIVTPQVGWLWTFESGLSLGFGIGAQMPLGSVPQVTSRSRLGSLPPAAELVRSELEADVRRVARFATKLPLPIFDLFKVGMFF